MASNTDDRYAGEGGFIQPRVTAMPSPAPTTGSTRAAAGLPQPRSKPLAPGSRKEDYARDYVSQKLMHISRRFVKKHGLPDPSDEVSGYASMDEVCRDLEGVVEVLWFSGTPSIQIPYLLNVALAFKDYLPSFPPSPRPTFALLKKLDHCFASLLVGRDIKSDQPLPGFQRGLSAGFSRTDMVRVKSLADDTRMLVAVTMSGEADVVDDDEAGEDAGGRNKSNMPPQNDDDEDDDDNDDFIDVPGPSAPSAPGKRKTHPEEDRDGFKTDEDYDMTIHDTITHNTTDDELDAKRIKLEEEADADPVVTDWQPAGFQETPAIKAEDKSSASAVPPTTNGAGDHSAYSTEIKTEDDGDHDRPVNRNEGKFQWAIDTDDSDSDSDDGAAAASTSGLQSRQSQPTSVQQQRPPAFTGSTATAAAGPYSPVEPPDDDDAAEGADEADEDDEEEEELHLNVAQVYEKTLVQLGETLGESIVDD